MSDTPTRYNGIRGLTGREPVGAVLRIGRKHPERGFPIDRDRFYFARTTQDATGSRPLHPAFATFNGAADASKCATVRLAIMHATRDECFEAYLRNQKAPARGDSPPGERPWCTGNGTAADRWNGREFERIVCPNDRCEYRQPGSGARGAGRACKPHARLLAQVWWPEEFGERFPSMLVRFSTNSWNSAAALLGYFDWWDRVALELTLRGADLVEYVEGYDADGNVERVITARRYSMIGARFSLTLQEKSDRDPRTGEARKYPIVTVAPIDDPIEHLTNAARRVLELRDAGRAAVAMLTDAEHLASRDADFVANEAGAYTDGAES